MRLFFSSLVAVTLCSAAPILSNAQSGCTDPAASNYDMHATINDGSCIYPLTRDTPTLKGYFGPDISESSGLVFTDGKLWTHNDSGNPQDFFSVDTATGATLQTVVVDNFPNTDWEDITADSNYIYLSDCGNNDGNRKDLKILKIAKKDIGSGTTVHVNAQAINVSYTDQTSFTASSTNNFDCESVLSKGDSLYLFTKDRGDGATRVYKVCKTPGTYALTPYTTYMVNGLITGADYDPVKNEVVLVGYLRSHASPFLWILNDFSGDMFFSGNKRRIELGPAPEWQTEGVAYRSSGQLFISCESNNGINASLYTTDENWKPVPTSVAKLRKPLGIIISPNPTSDILTISGYTPARARLYNTAGQLVIDTVNSKIISLEKLAPGNYFIRLCDADNQTVYQQQITKN
ncbi:MAG: T9SS type A sorting domain-containing protein [Bacteroidetes bacterium]|nr:T9SS type A sorting domain-containing protein [Bacteroidota bacterium]